MSNELSTDVKINQLEALFGELMESYDDATGKISETVSFSDADLEKAKDQLTEFVVHSNQIANQASFRERTLRILKHIPLAGAKANAAITEIRKERLNDQSITEVVDQLYNGIKKRADSLENAINSMIGIKEETETLVTKIRTLDFELDNMMSDGQVPSHKRLTMTKISSQIKTMISNSEDKIQELSVISKVAEGVLMNMIKVIPISRSELLSRIVMDAGVSQINAIHKDVQDIMELNHDITENMNTKTRKAIMGLLENQTVSETQVKRISKSTDDRMEMMGEISDAAHKFEKNIYSTHKMIVDNMAKADAYRLELSAKSPALLTINHKEEAQ